MKINNAKLYDLTASGIVSLYALICFARFAYFPANALVSAGLIFAGFASVALLLFDLKKRYLGPYLLTCFFLISYLVSALSVSNFDRVFHGLTFIAINSGIALTLVAAKRGSNFIGILFYFYVIYFGMNIVLGTSAREVFSHTSHNSISMLLIVICVTYYASNYNDGKAITIWPAVLTVVICVWAIGRGGIFSSLLLLFGVLLLNSVRGRSVIIMVLTTLFLMILVSDELQFGLLEAASGLDAVLTAVERFNSEEVRLTVWGNYFSNLDLYRIVLGANIFEDPWPDGAALAYNYHNSYIHLHSRTGLYSIFLFVLTAFALVEYARFNKLYFILFLTVIIRMSTDFGLFFESFDFIYLYFIFYYLVNPRNRKAEFFTGQLDSIQGIHPKPVSVNP